MTTLSFTGIQENTWTCGTEYQAKELFAAHGVPAPAGKVARTVEEAVAAAEELGTR